MRFATYVSRKQHAEPPVLEANHQRSIVLIQPFILAARRPGKDHEADAIDQQVTGAGRTHREPTSADQLEKIAVVSGREGSGRVGHEHLDRKSTRDLEKAT
jgi:hypothetical protein